MIVLVGHGRWGRVYAGALRQAGMLGAIAVSSETSALKLAGQVREPCGSDLGVLVSQSGARALAILSPTPWHAHHVRVGLALGLPCLVIKPVASRAAFAWRLDADVRACGGIVDVVHEALWNPPVRVLLDAIAAGRVGDVQAVHILRQGQDRGPAGTAPRPMPEVAGANFAWLFDAVVHEATVANRLLGRSVPAGAEVAEVWASAAHPRLAASWRWPEGRVVRVRYDGDPALPFRWAVAVTGSHGKIEAWAEAGRSGVTWTQSDGARSTVPVTSRGAPEDLAVAAFLAVVEGVAPPDETVADGARAIEAAEMLVRAAAERAGWTWDESAVFGRPDVE